jgi:hypothetical protein
MQKRLSPASVLWLLWSNENKAQWAESPCNWLHFQFAANQTQTEQSRWSRGPSHRALTSGLGHSCSLGSSHDLEQFISFFMFQITLGGSYIGGRSPLFLSPKSRLRARAQAACPKHPSPLKDQDHTPYTSPNLSLRDHSICFDVVCLCFLVLEIKFRALLIFYRWATTPATPPT